jgi:prepilin-type N-terminal cleavage/methylation domain-containing protein
MTRQKVALRPGVTLIELLIAIAIIGILAALLYVGITAAVRTTRTAILAREVKEIGAALEQFKAAHGVYPIDHQRSQEFEAFVRKAYPRAVPESLAAFKYAIDHRSGAQPQQGKSISESEALVLYLRFMSKDPRNPYRFATIMANDLVPTGGIVYEPSFRKPLPDDLEVFYEFPPDALIDFDRDGFPEFSQKYAQGMPLIYHDARTYQCEPSVKNDFPWARWPNIETNSAERPSLNDHFASAYAASYDPVNNRFTFINPTSYQLICAGHDGDFGVEGMTIAPGVPRICYPVFTKSDSIPFPRLPLEEADNITNFTDGMTFRAYLAQ